MNARKTQSDSKRRTLEARTKEVFEESLGALDGHTRSRLAQARSRALEELNSRAGRRWGASWAPAGAVALAALATWMLWFGRPEPEGTAAFSAAAASDLEILLGEEELEMIQELEFYAWLEDQAELTTNGREDVIG